MLAYGSGRLIQKYCSLVRGLMRSSSHTQTFATYTICQTVVDRCGGARRCPLRWWMPCGRMLCHKVKMSINQPHFLHCLGFPITSTLQAAWLVFNWPARQEIDHVFPEEMHEGVCVCVCVDSGGHTCYHWWNTHIKFRCTLCSIGYCISQETHAM